MKPRLRLKKSAHWLAALYLMGTSSMVAGETMPTNIDKNNVLTTMRKVADWQWQQFDEKSNRFAGYDNLPHMSPNAEGSHSEGWVYAALYVGMARYALLGDELGNDKEIKRLANIAAKSRYLFGPRIYHADDYAIGQLYLDLYDRFHDEKMITPLKTIFDLTLNSPPASDMHFEGVSQKSKFTGQGMGPKFGDRKYGYVPCTNRWCWADALFMGPPVWFHLANATGDKRYQDYADKEFWVTVDLLWDEQDRLFFRDSTYFDKREPNGEKVIWARGVGWVAAGMARILEQLPEDYPERARYEAIFRKMMTRLAGVQQNDGFWRPSVLDPNKEPYKESSGTALITFAYLSGINQGVLDKAQFMPTVEAAWQGLAGVVTPEGKVGWVQQIAASPESVNEENTQLYAVGGFLLTATELYKLLSEGEATNGKQ